jgi:hypothetical protein
MDDQRRPIGVSALQRQGHAIGQHSYHTSWRAPGVGFSQRISFGRCAFEARERGKEPSSFSSNINMTVWLPEQGFTKLLNYI